MEKRWLKNYQQGVAAEINLDSFQSVSEVFEHAVKKFSHRPAVANMDKVLTYAEIDRLSMQFASFLQHELKLGRGSRVAIMMPNLLQYPVAVFGILRAGMTVVNVNPLYTPRELGHQLKDAGVETILILENFANTLQQVVKRTPVKNIIVTSIGDLLGFPKSLIVNFVVKHVKKMVPNWQLANVIRLPDALKKGDKQPYQKVSLTHDDIAFLQ